MNLINTKKNVALLSTRPYEKNIVLLKELEKTNILLLNHPLTEIKPLNNYDKFDSIICNLKKYQHIIFISSNAVKFFVERYKNLSIELPDKIIFSSIGLTTKKNLESHFKTNVHCPEDIYDSEHLIKKKIFDDIKNKKVLIIRGIGGRETLKNALKEKGAEVEYGECYIRNYLIIQQENIIQEIKNFNSIFILISSYESAKQFIESSNKWLNKYKIKFIVSHKKIGLLLEKEYPKNINGIIVTNDLTSKSLSNIIKKN